MPVNFGIAGAGLSGAVVARRLADAGHSVTVFDRRPHIAGNCHTERDDDTDVMIHRYGPHIFHTSNQTAWDWVNRFADMVPFRLAVKTTVDGFVYSLPVNLHTINQVFGTAMRPAEAEAFIARLAERCDDPANFEQAAVAAVGRRLYQLFFEGYTTKQWGRHPATIPASVFRRLPVRFDYDDNYFTHRWQAIPRDGYTAMIEAMLHSPNITVHTGREYPSSPTMFDHTIWTGPIDAYFQHRHGRLAYRTTQFVNVTSDGDYQGTPLMNYGDVSVPFTRITEHKHFAPWETHDRTVTSAEYSSEAGPGDEPFYPVRADTDIVRLHAYLNAATNTPAVTFVGRLATYRYLDMDVTITEALHAADIILTAPGRIPSITHKETH